jgi:2-dehydro-3-deoxyglucarate aldolase
MGTELQPNLVKRSLIRRECSIGCWLMLSSPAAAEALAHCGFDWLLIDQEHAPNDTGDVIHHLRAIDAARSRGAEVEAVVRVAAHDPMLVKRAMDAGARTIIFPTVEDEAQARQAVRSTRFPAGDNGGIRGIAGIVRAGTYGLDPDYVSRANDEASVIVQIETAAGVAHADAIAAVDGVDCLFIGPADLSSSLGHAGNPSHPTVREAMRNVCEAAARAGKAAGIFALSVDEALACRDWGFQMISLHSDVAWITRAARAAVGDFRTRTCP